MSEILLISAFFFIPIGSLIFFLISLFRFLSAKKKNKETPGSVAETKISRLKLLLIISGVLAGIFIALMIGIIVLFLMAIAYM